GVLTSADPRTLVNRGPAIPLATEVNPDSAALDEAGRLWVLDAASGDLVWIEHGQRHSRRGGAQPGTGRLGLADGAPGGIDPAGGSAPVLAAGSPATRPTVALDLRAGARIQVSGPPHSAGVSLVAAGGVLDICALHASSCPPALPLGGGTGDLGPPVETGG